MKLSETTKILLVFAALYWASASNPDAVRNFKENVGAIWQTAEEEFNPQGVEALEEKINELQQRIAQMQFLSNVPAYAGTADGQAPQVAPQTQDQGQGVPPAWVINSDDFKRIEAENRRLREMIGLLEIANKDLSYSIAKAQANATAANRDRTWTMTLPPPARDLDSVRLSVVHYSDLAALRAASQQGGRP